MLFESALPWIYILLHIIVFWSWKKYPRHASAPRKNVSTKSRRTWLASPMGCCQAELLLSVPWAQKKLMLLGDETKSLCIIDVLFGRWHLCTFLLCHYVWYLWYPFKFRVFSCIPMRIFYLYYYTFLICRYVAPSLEYIYLFLVLDWSTFCWPRLCFPGNAFSRCQTDVNRGVLQLDLFSQKSLPFDFLKGNCWWKKPCTTWHV